MSMQVAMLSQFLQSQGITNENCGSFVRVRVDAATHITIWSNDTIKVSRFTTTDASTGAGLAWHSGEITLVDLVPLIRRLEQPDFSYEDNWPPARAKTPVRKGRAQTIKVTDEDLDRNRYGLLVSWWRDDDLDCIPSLVWRGVNCTLIATLDEPDPMQTSAPTEFHWSLSEMPRDFDQTDRRYGLSWTCPDVYDNPTKAFAAARAYLETLDKRATFDEAVDLYVCKTLN